jgi:hypothetical protein
LGADEPGAQDGAGERPDDWKKEAKKKCAEDCPGNDLRRAVATKGDSHDVSLLWCLNESDNAG